MSKPSKYERRVRSAKLKARSELGDSPHSWYLCKYADNFDLSLSTVCDSCPRIDACKVTYEEFVARYERPYKPVVVQNAQNDWKANENWTLKRLDKKYHNERFKCGEDDKGCSVKLKMKYFIQYMKENEDDSPLYIFDANYGEARWCFFISTENPKEHGFKQKHLMVARIAMKPSPLFVYVYPRTQANWPQNTPALEILQKSWRDGLLFLVFGGTLSINLTDRCYYAKTSAAFPDVPSSSSSNLFNLSSPSRSSSYCSTCASTNQSPDKTPQTH
ncbi:Bifunctional arginine demethylase and lysyl-hydroxylase JMJD6, partial [Schistosoma japonicum]